MFNLTVYDFDINVQVPTMKNHGKKNKKKQNKKLSAEERTEKEDQIKNQLHAGFVLKRFDNEADYARFEDRIMETYEGYSGSGDAPTCIFESDINDGGDNKKRLRLTDSQDTSFDNDTGNSVVFLSMKDAKIKKQETPYVTHSFSADEQGYYFLCYQVCYIPSSADTNDEKAISLEEEVIQTLLQKRVKSSFELDIVNKNYDLLGRVSYLTAGDVHLPLLFLYFSISYAMLFHFWWKNIKQMSTTGSNVGSSSDPDAKSSQQNVHAIHHMMSAVLLLKTITIFFESARYHYIQHYGHAELLSFVYYTFSFLKGMFLFTVVLLIGSGWSFFKPFLNPKEKRIILLVIILQVIDNIIIVILSQEVQGERLYDDWSAILHLVDIICCCTVLVPIVWQVNALEQSVEETEDSKSDSNGETDSGCPVATSVEKQRMLSKLQLFRSFYVLVVAYIYFTRIVVFIVASKLNYKHDWIKYLLTELGTLAFYVIVGIKFRPTEENKYAPVENDEEEEVTLYAKRTVGAIEMSEMGERNDVV